MTKAMNTCQKLRGETKTNCSRERKEEREGDTDRERTRLSSLREVPLDVVFMTVPTIPVS